MSPSSKPTTSAGTVRARIYRFDPSVDASPRYDSFEVPFVDGMRVLDVLDHVYEELAENIGYRWYCGVQRCGSCAVRVNGREMLACWEPAERDMVIEPLRHAGIVRDLVIDRTDYEKRVDSLKPSLKRSEPYPGFPEPLRHGAFEAASQVFDCLNCLACQSACPVLGLGGDIKFIGPAPLVQLAQRALDPRDSEDRGALALDLGAVFECISCYKCQEVCPVDIPVVEAAIEPLKALAFRRRPAAAGHVRALMETVERRGRVEPIGLMFRARGLGALADALRAATLVLRGKIRPWHALFGNDLAAPARGEIGKLFARRRGPDR